MQSTNDDGHQSEPGDIIHSPPTSDRLGKRVVLSGPRVPCTAMNQPHTAALHAIHHIGIVVAQLSTSVEWYTSCCGAQQTTGAIFDPLQKVRVMFLKINAGPLVELVEPVGIDSPAARLASMGGGLHHLCFEVLDIRQSMSVLQQSGARVVCEPVPAVAFAGRLIAFMYTQGRILVELLQKSPE